MDPVVTEGAVRTVEKVASRVVTNTTVVQRTANTNSVHVNKYDADGNLKSSSVDSESWVDRDTKTYEWQKPADRPATPPGEPSSAAVAVPGAPTATGDELSVEKFLASEQQSPSTETGGATLVMTTTDLVPGVSWSGTTVEERQSNVVAVPPSSTGSGDGPATDVQTSQRTTTNMSGESWSRSGEAVWITESTSSAAPTPQPSAVAAPVANGVAVGVLVDVSSSSSSNSASAAPPRAAQIGVDAHQLRPVPVTAVVTVPAASVAVSAEPPPLSVDERRRKRCLENRARRAAAGPTVVQLSSTTA